MGGPNRNQTNQNVGKVQTTNKQLPKTGNDVNSFFVWLGFLLLGISVFIMKKANKVKM
ncbi:LPXTG cell wall anchor domain-containing protein [Enterococcus sp. AZ109]|uniref:LPXTG cell wall anchor domain-containing protein n=1 Tax=Enterococcus sp. AZ109 TaxID=2774634 RepID=UPI003F686219